MGTTKAAKASKFTPPVKDSYTAFPSRYGSHKSMVDSSVTLKDEKLVVCKDEGGQYVTEKNNLDNRCADPWRFATEEWRKKTFEAAEKIEKVQE
jgi:hypothetical protein